jgi:replication factor C small subunit
MKDLIWAEKYRPKNLDSMALWEHDLKAFKKYIDQKEIPHLLFHGPAGSGKTTLAKILIKDIASGNLSLNASSSDRGIAVVKGAIKSFAASKPKKRGGLNIIFLDEADGLTNEAQNALLNTIEKYHSNCRFILTCNQIEKLIEPLVSRCIIYQFESLPIRNIKSMCYRILKKEKIKFNRKILSDIVDRYYPDVRSIINNLQACSVSGELTNQYLDRLDPEAFVALLKNGEIFALREMWANARDFTRLYSFLFENCGVLTKNNDDKADSMIAIADYLYKDRTIADREINFTACVLEILAISGRKINFGKNKR